MKIIRIIPFVTLLAAASLFSLSNSQIIEKAEAISTSYRYFISTESKTYGIEKNPSSTYPSTISFNELAKPYVFEEVTGGFKIKNIVSGRYLCHVENDIDVRFPSTTTNYVSVWSIGVENEHTYLKSSNNRYLYLYDNSTWKVQVDLDSTCYLNIFSVEEDAAPFVTAMKNIYCDDGVTPPATDEWAAAGTAFGKLPEPVKNYLITLPGDKDAADTTIEWALAKYDYIIGKYLNRTDYPAFIRSTPLTEFAYSNTVPSFGSVETNYPIIIATVLVVTLSLTSILLIKKKQK